MKDHTNFALKFVTNAEDHVTAVQVQRSSGIWLPDVVFAPRSTIAYAKLPSGYTGQLITHPNYASKMINCALTASVSMLFFCGCASGPKNTSDLQG